MNIKYAIVFLCFSLNYNLVTAQFDSRKFVTKDTVIYKTNILIVINDSIKYDFDSKTHISEPNIPKDKLLKASTKTFAISSKEKMKNLGYDTLYSAIFFLTIDDKVLKKLESNQAY
jgi:hypothetical protein